MRRALFLSSLVVVAFAGVAAAQPATVTSDIAEPDLAVAIDLVVLSEGYAAHEHDLFLSDARRLGRTLRRGATSRPMRAANAFNLHYVFIASTQSGAPWTPGQRPRATPLRAHVTDEGDLELDTARSDVLAARHAPDTDVVVVLINLLADDHPAARPSPIPEVVANRDEVRAVADVPSQGSRIWLPAHDIEAFLHELGHALYGLGDEYWEYDGEIPADERYEVASVPNLSTDPSGARWAHIVPTVFEGGGYYARGVYRAERRCRMKETRSERFCAVCVDAIAAPALDAPARPAASSPRSGATLVASLAADGSPAVEASWRHGSDGPPLHYVVELYRLDADGASELVWDDYVEGHLRSVQLPADEDVRARYRVMIQAAGLLYESPTVQRTFWIRPAPAAVGGARGLIDRLGLD